MQSLRRLRSIGEIKKWIDDFYHRFVFLTDLKNEAAVLSIKSIFNIMILTIGMFMMLYYCIGINSTFKRPFFLFEDNIIRMPRIAVSTSNCKKISQSCNCCYSVFYYILFQNYFLLVYNHLKWPSVWWILKTFKAFQYSLALLKPLFHTKTSAIKINWFQTANSVKRGAVQT